MMQHTQGTFLGITPVSSVSNGLYFLTVPLVSFMRVIYTSKGMSKKFGVRTVLPREAHSKVMLTDKLLLCLKRVGSCSVVGKQSVRIRSWTRDVCHIRLKRFPHFRWVPNSGWSLSVSRFYVVPPFDRRPESLNRANLYPVWSFKLHLNHPLIAFETKFIWVWNLVIVFRETYRLRVFENRVLRKIFGLKRDEVTGEWRRLHDG